MDGKHSFSPPATVPANSGASAPGAAFGDGHLAAARGTAERVITAWLRPNPAVGGSAMVTVGSADGAVRAQVVDSTACGNAAPAVAAYGDTVLVAWWAPRSGPAELRVARSDDGGRTFGHAATAGADSSVTTCPQAAPALAVDSTGAIHLAWTGAQPSARIAYVTQPRGSRQFSALHQVSVPGGATDVRLAADPHGLTTAWLAPEHGSVARVARVTTDATRGLTLSAVQTMPGTATAIVLFAGRSGTQLGWVQATPQGATITLAPIP